jgi:hypothetical protein
MWRVIFCLGCGDVEIEERSSKEGTRQEENVFFERDFETVFLEGFGSMDSLCVSDLLCEDIARHYG